MRCAATLLTGILGAAHLGVGYLSVGTGAALVSDGTSTLWLSSLTFLDRVSQGTAYSSRASAALTCQATFNPDNLLGYQAALFANQPSENTEGLTEPQLAALVDNPVDIAGGLTAGDCLALSQANTEQTLNGSITNVETTRIQGPPTVLVNGSLYSGGLTDPEALLDFLRSAAAG